MKRTLLLTIGVFLLTANLSFAQKKYPAAKARDHVGEYATVVGMVYQVFESRKGIIYLDIGGKNPSNTFTVVINARDTSKFINFQRCKRKIVDVTGKIQMYHGTPEIFLSDPAQLKIEASDSRKYKS